MLCSEPGCDFFFCKRGLPFPNISANHMARILSTSYVHVHVHTRPVNVCAMLMISYVILKYAPYDWLKCNPRLQNKKSQPGRGEGGRGGSRVSKKGGNTASVRHVMINLPTRRPLPPSGSAGMGWGGGAWRERNYCSARVHYISTGVLFYCHGDGNRRGGVANGCSIVLTLKIYHKTNIHRNCHYGFYKLFL